MNELKEIVRDNRFSLSLTINAFAISLYAIQEARINLSTEGIGNFGLISILPMSYFAALSMLTLSFLIALKSRKKNEKLLFLQVMILVFFLYLAPIAIELNRARFSYSTYGFVDFVVKNGFIDASKVWYHNWPAFIILFSSIVTISGMDPELLIKSFPVLPEFLYIFALRMFFGTVYHDHSRIWIAVWTFFISNWIGQDFLSSQSVGIFLYIVLMAILIRVSNSNDEKIKIDNGKRGSISNSIYMLLLVIIFTALVTGHFLSSLFIFSIFLVYFIAKRNENFVLVKAALVIIFSWTIYGAAVYFKSNVKYFVSNALDFDLIFGSNLVNRVAGSPEHMFISEIKIFYSILIGLFVLSGLYLSKKSGFTYNDKTIIICSISLLLFSIFFPYGGELFMRIFLFGLILMVYFFSKNIESRSTFIFVVIFLLIAQPLYILTRYGNEGYDYIPEPEIKGAEFLYEKVSDGYIMMGSPWGEYKRAYTDFYPVIFPPNKTEIREDILIPNINDMNKVDGFYTILTYGDRLSFRLFYNESVDELIRYDLEKHKNYQKIYSNPSFDIYKYMRDL